MQQDLIHEYYWNIVLWDGETIKVKPENADMVQKKIATTEGAINTNTRSILVKNIKDFVITDEIYTDQKLLEDTARAFKEPIMFERDSGMGYKEMVMEAKWVKKSVSQRRWTSYYSANPAYKKIAEDDNHVTIAFRVATHDINPQIVTELTIVEIDENHLK